MARERPVDHNRPVFDHLHPKVYATAVGFVIWFAVAAWILFDHRLGGQSEVSLPLAMMSVLLLIAVVLPWALSLIWKRDRMPYDGHTTSVTYRDWRRGDFAVWGGRVHSMHAAIDMLLPLAAVAFGLTCIGIVFLICASLAS